jgi:hypothetical protein
MIYRKIQTTVLPLILLLCSQLPSVAVSVNGNLATAFWTRENRLEKPEDSETNLLLYEYLRFHATDLGTSKLGAHVSGRVGWDRFESLGEKYTSRLYQGYLDWKLSRTSALRLGRQFLPNDMGFWQMDGARFQLQSKGLVSPTLYAGMGVLPWTIEGNDEVILGIELRSKRLWSVRSKISLLTIFDSDNEEDLAILGIKRVDKTILGVQFDTFGGGIHDLFETPHKRLNISGRGNIDLITKEIIDGYISSNVNVTRGVQLYLEYSHKVPLFPADSIFSVFAAEPFDQLTVSASYGLTSFLDLHARYARQFFDLEPIDQYGAGFSVKSQRETLLALRLDHLVDIDRHYWRLYSRIGKRLTKRFEVTLNNYYSNYKLTRALDTEDAYTFQLKASYRLTRNMHALIRLEDNINPDYKYNIRALGYLRMRFGFER